MFFDNKKDLNRHTPNALKEVLKPIEKSVFAP